MYMKYAVNEEGITALRNISATLTESAVILFERTSRLQEKTQIMKKALVRTKVL